MDLTDKNILIITLIMYIIALFVSTKFKIKWLLLATVVLWFVPIFLVDNLFIVVFSVVMIVVTITITLFNREDEWG